MAGNYDKFTPVIQLDEITSAEETMLAELVALANSPSGQYLRKSGGSIVNASLSEVVSFSSLSDVAITSGAAGDILYFNGTNWVNLAAGPSGSLLRTNGAGNAPSWVVAGTGTVTEVSVVTANGVSAVVANATTTPSMTFTLGAITPSSVVTTGSITVGTSLLPDVNDGAVLGASGTAFSDLYLASGAIIDFNAGDIVLTHSANLVTLTGGDLTISGALTVTGTTTLAVGLTGVLRADAGVIATDSDVTDIVSAASLVLAGKVELATTAEINTGTDSTRAVPVDQYVASNRNVRYFNIRVLDPSSAHTVTTTIGGDFEVPFTGTITEIGGWEDTAGTTGIGTVDVNLNGTTLMTVNKLTFDSTEKTTRTAATAPALTTTAVTAGDIITVDIDAIQTTAARGLVIRLGIRLT